MIQYCKKLWQLRFFVVYLVFNDLRQKYRKSYLGVLWAVLQPLMFGVIITTVVGRFTGQTFGEFFPFVFVGFCVWGLITDSLGASPMTYLASQHYIRQYSNPLMVFSIRLVLLNALNFTFALSGAIAVIFFIDHIHMGWALLILPINLVIVMILLSAIANVIALLGTIFRDMQQLVGLLLQVVFYMSPILFRPEFFINAGMEIVLKVNPIYYALRLFREPILENQIPSLNTYIAIFIMIAVAYVVNIFYIMTTEKKIIYYL